PYLRGSRRCSRFGWRRQAVLKRLLERLLDLGTIIRIVGLRKIEVNARLQVLPTIEVRLARGIRCRSRGADRRKRIGSRSKRRRGRARTARQAQPAQAQSQQSRRGERPQPAESSHTRF